MKLTDLFDRTYVLNLPQRADRRGEMTKVLREAGIDWEPGKVEIFPATRPGSAGDFESIGAHGCYLSHLGILKQARDLGVARLLVMEDDLELSPKLPEALGQIADRLARDDWGFAFLGHKFPDDETTAPPGSFVEYRGDLKSNHLFAVNGRILDELIAFLEAILRRPPGHPDGGPMHVDGAFLTFCRLHVEFLTLVSHPRLGWQRSSMSDIAERRVDRLPVIGDLIRVARRVKRRLASRDK